MANEVGLPTPGSVRETQRLVDLGDHLEHAPPLESHWLDLSPKDLDGAAATGMTAYNELAEQMGEFGVAWPARAFDDFPADIAAQLREARDEVQRCCGWSTGWADDLSALPDALHALDQLPGLIDAVRERAATVAQFLGQDPGSLTKERLEGLAKLADLAFNAESRPERAWLVRAGLERAARIHEELADDLVVYQRQRAQIVEHYTEGALQLDAAQIAERFANQYTSVLSKLSGAYRQDAKAIKVTRKDGKLPSTLADDLKLIRMAREVGTRIDAQAERTSQALGSYAQGRDSDAQVVAEAIAVAREAVALSAPDADLQALGDKLAVGSAPDPRLAQAAEQLRVATESLLSRLPAIQRFVAAPAELLSGELDQLEQRLSTLDPAIRALSAVIDDLNTGAAVPLLSIEEARQRATLISALHASHQRVRTESDIWHQIIGASFTEASTDWAALRAAAHWLEALRGFDHDALTAPIRHQLLSELRVWPAFTELGRHCDRTRGAIEQLTRLFDAERAGALDTLCEHASPTAVDELCQHLGERVDELRDWTEWCAWRDRARAHGWQDFVNALIAAHVGEAEVLSAFQRSYWNRRLEILYDDDPDFADDLHGGAFQRWVDEFRELDRKLVRTGADRLIQRREGARTSHVSTPGSEIELLRREARKKRRHLPVRVLLSRIPTLLSDLKPCLMMSPLTVSHFLSSDHTFDMVVFDEASQVPPQDAINCIYRGRQLVVAGDSKQLPPTPFFQIAELDELAPEEE